MPVHAYQFVAGTDPSRTPLIMLHGSGRSEADMVPLAAELAPQAMAVALRGAVPWEDGFAFFRRFEDRAIDEGDLRARAAGLADDVVAIGADCGFARPPIAVAFSNGAIMAAALMMLHPGLMSGAVLFRPLSPFAGDPETRLASTPVLIIDGRDDTRRSPGDGACLAGRLARMGADVTQHELPTGHSIGSQDFRLAREWLLPLL